MALAINTVVGEQIVAPGVNAPLRQGTLGDLVVSELHGRYFEMARNRRMFSAVSLARATSLPSTSAIGLIVWNPPGSGVRLALNKWTSMVVATSATLTGIALAGGFQTTAPTGLTAADSAGSNVVNGIVRQAGLAQAYAVATVLTAAVNVMLLHHNTAAINTVGADQMSGDLEGSVIVEQGGFVHICALGAAAAASGHSCSLMWEEVPV